ncbi:serine hydrolase [Nocardiopsis sp. N85]|uniref:serine hydrolase domain-containing protein n=1 Tax=Nocardiopsis sp. N85 TaxID=3029400 RepID=UPI00237F561B|nr:serine hydrolase domain-containing protein [Nocardiopsis sp. N85]MDE3723048.1 serine hydrolase [Nocardiopsis sp. N85]
MPGLMTRLVSPAAAAFVLAIPIAAAPASADPTGVPTPAVSAAATPLTVESAGEFTETRVAELLEEYGAPGVAVTIVTDDGPIATVAHGHADLAEGSPLDPAVHVFPTASVAKSFTAAAVLTMVEEGRLDLTEDVNTYLPEDVRLPGETITLHDLLTHTPGFAEMLERLGGDEGGELGEAVRTAVPEPLFAPGEYTAYSNYGLALAGYIVQEVSGVPFEEYARLHVFEPLGMEDTAFTQIPDARAERPVVTPHLVDGTPAEDLYIMDVPAGAAVTTVDDMARFMTALLDEGRVDGEEALPAGVVEAMLGRQEEMHPATTGMGYGTYQWRTGDSPAFGHGGDLPGIHTGYVVVPEIGAGVFVAVNGDDAAQGDPFLDLRMAVVTEFLETFAPQEPPTGAADPAADLSAFEGTYVTSRRPVSGPAKLVTLFDNVTVSDAGDGTLSVIGEFAADERWLPVSVDEGVFVAENGTDVLGFVERDGHMVAVAFDANPTNVYTRTGALGTPATHLLIAGAGLLVLLTVLIPVQRSGNGFTLATRVTLTATALAAFTGVGLLVYGIMDLHRAQIWLIERSPALTVPLTVAGVLALVSTVLVGVCLARGWLRPFSRVHLSLAALAGLAVTAIGLVYGLVISPI